MTVVYDFEHGHATWELFAAGATAFALGLAICLTFRDRLGTTKTNVGVMPSWIFFGLMTTVGSCITGSIAADGYSSDRALRAQVRSGACEQVEGPVEALTVGGYKNHEGVDFVVGGRHFPLRHQRAAGHDRPAQARRPVRQRNARGGLGVPLGHSELEHDRAFRDSIVERRDSFCISPSEADVCTSRTTRSKGRSTRSKGCSERCSTRRESCHSKCGRRSIALVMPGERADKLTELARVHDETLEDIWRTGNVNVQRSRRHRRRTLVAGVCASVLRAAANASRRRAHAVGRGRRQPWLACAP